MKIIRAADCREVPWKNGGGTTREIAVFPPGAGMDDFIWRLSMATVVQAGAFSTFEGVDRVLAVLGGRLRLSGTDFTTELDSATTPFSFDGGAAIIGEPLSGPVVDLNAMARRGRCAVSMQRLRAGDHIPGGESFLLALEPQQLQGEALGHLDCARLAYPAVVNGNALHIGFAVGKRP